MSGKKVKDTDYLFLSAMLRARESKMLDRERIDRMLSALNFAEAARLLTDVGYEDMSYADAKGVDALLSERRKAIFDEIGRMAPKSELVDAFRLKYDYHNAKVIIKAESAGVSGEYLLSACGRVEGAVLLQAYEEDDFRSLPAALGRAMQEAKATLARTGNPQLADIELDRAYFAEMTDMAEETGSAFLKNYVRLLIDSANLRTAVRVIRMGRGQDFMMSALISGGGADPGRIADAALSGGEALASAVTDPYLQQAVSLGAEAMKGGPVTAFELACDNCVSAFLSSAKMVPFGSEAVVEYLALVEAEITAIRMILTERLAGIEPDVTRERLRDINA